MSYKNNNQKQTQAVEKKIVIAERDNIAALLENKKVTDFFIQRGDVLLGDVYLASVDNILPSIDAAFVNVGTDKMGFLHAEDVMGKGSLKDKLSPKQKLVVQVVKEPTGHKGPRVTTEISLPGRFLVLMPYEPGISVSKKIENSKERARLKAIVNLIKPVGVGVIIRTEAEGQSEADIQEDLETLIKELHSIIPQLSYVGVSDIRNLRYNEMYDKLIDLAKQKYKEHEEEMVNFYNEVISQYEENPTIQHPFEDGNIARNVERDIMLQVVDNRWIDHLHNIDILRDGINLRAYGQKDPLIEYKKEAYDLFNNMMYDIQAETVKHLFRTKFGVQIVKREEVETDLSRAAENFDSSENKEEETDVKPVKKGEKIGRNDPCPCGSGKKYKNCCMNK